MPRLHSLRPLVTSCLAFVALFTISMNDPHGALAQGPQTAGVASAHAERQFTILIFESPRDLARRSSPNEGRAYWQAYFEFARGLARAGALRGGSALSEDTAETVRGRGSADRGVDGARLGGYFVVAADSLDAARALALRAPSFAVAVEIRPHRANPGMAGSAP